MKITAAALALIAAQTAFAEPANRPFTTRNGRTVVSAPPSRPQAQAAAGPAAAQAPAIGSEILMAPPSSGGRSFMGGGRQVMSRGSQRGATRRGGRAFWSGRKVDAEMPAPAPEEVPAHFKTPGALIRTAGQQPKYAEAEAVREHTVAAGEIAFNEKRGYHVGRSPGLHQGPKDTLPPPNPGTYTKTFTSGVGANSGSGGDTGGDTGGDGGSGGHDNNGSGNNGKDKPGDDDDGHGGSKKAGADPTGFYSAF